MGILKKLFGKGKCVDSESRRDTAADNLDGRQKGLAESKKNTRNCDKCGSPLSSPDGYLLDAQKEEIEKRRSFVGLAIKTGAAGVIANLSPVAFVCEACLAKEAAAQGRPVDLAIKLMSHARAMNLWDTGEWERPMFPDEFPPESEEKRLPWMNAALEAKFKKECGGEPGLDDYLAIRADILARCLAQTVHRVTFRNPCVTDAAGFAVVIAEIDPTLSWDKCLRGVIERRLLARIGEATKVWFISYRDSAETWFTHRMLPYVATAVANALGQSLTQLEFACYIDNKGRRYLTITG